MGAPASLTCRAERAKRNRAAPKGTPVHDDKKLFEFLVLEGAQAGLSWSTILNKRENYRAAFDGFDFHKVARFDAAREARLLADAGIVRNRLKIKAAIKNAQVCVELVRQHGSLDAYFWAFVEHKPLLNDYKGANAARAAHRSRESTDSRRIADLASMPTTTPLSDRLSKELKARGMKFVGSTIMQSFGAPKRRRASRSAASDA